MSKRHPLHPGSYYHVYNRGNDRETLFREERNYHYFLQLYARYMEPVVETYTYCLLPNHFHLLLRVREEPLEPRSLEERRFFNPDSSRQFSRLFGTYTKAINNGYARTGTLFEGRFKRKVVDDEAYLLTLVIYIHTNPQRHGLVSDFRNWPFSSYMAILSTRPSRIQREAVLAWFDGHRSFTDTHQMPLDESLVEPLAFD